MALSAQNLTRGPRVDPEQLYRVTLTNDIPCPAPITGSVAAAQRCINARGAHERVVRDLTANQLKPDGIFAIPQIARMEGEPQVLGVIGGTRMVSQVIGRPTRAWSFHELRGQVAFLGRGHIETMTLAPSQTTGSAISDTVNLVDDAIDDGLDKLKEAADSIPSVRTVVLVGAGVGGLLVASKIIRVFS